MNAPTPRARLGKARNESLAHLPNLKARVRRFFAAFPKDSVFEGGGHEMLIHDLSVTIDRLECRLKAAHVRADEVPDALDGSGACATTPEPHTAPSAYPSASLGHGARDVGTAFGVWQPISEEARIPPSVLVSTGVHVGEAKIGQRGWKWVSGHLCNPQPTVWMPLPEPPAGAA